MEKTVKTKTVVEVFSIMKTAKYSKMSDAEKISVWKIYKAIKTIGKEFEDDVEDLKQKLVPYENFADDVQKAINYENAKMNNTAISDMTDDDYKKFINTFRHFNDAVKDAVKEFEEKEVTITIEPLKEDAFDRFRASNDWTFEQSSIVEDFVC